MNLLERTERVLAFLYHIEDQRPEWPAFYILAYLCQEHGLGLDARFSYDHGHIYSHDLKQTLRQLETWGFAHLFPSAPAINSREEVNKVDPHIWERLEKQVEQPEFKIVRDLCFEKNLTLKILANFVYLFDRHYEVSEVCSKTQSFLMIPSYDLPTEWFRAQELFDKLYAESAKVDTSWRCSDAFIR